MNRRKFLHYLCGTSMAAALAPSGLLLPDGVIRLPEIWSDLGSEPAMALVNQNGEIVAAQRVMGIFSIREPDGFGELKILGFHPVIWTHEMVNGGGCNEINGWIASAVCNGRRIETWCKWRHPVAVTCCDTLVTHPHGMEDRDVDRLYHSHRKRLRA